jgi:hypothetical protein
MMIYGLAGGDWYIVWTSAGNEAPSQIALPAFDDFHATQIPPAIGAEITTKIPYNHQSTEGRGNPA